MQTTSPSLAQDLRGRTLTARASSLQQGRLQELPARDTAQLEPRFQSTLHLPAWTARPPEPAEMLTPTTHMRLGAFRSPLSPATSGILLGWIQWRAGGGGQKLWGAQSKLNVTLLPWHGENASQELGPIHGAGNPSSPSCVRPSQPSGHLIQVGEGQGRSSSVSGSGSKGRFWPGPCGSRDWSCQGVVSPAHVQSQPTQTAASKQRSGERCREIPAWISTQTYKAPTLSPAVFLLVLGHCKAQPQSQRTKQRGSGKESRSLVTRSQVVWTPLPPPSVAPRAPGTTAMPPAVSSIGRQWDFSASTSDHLGINQFSS